MTPAETVHQQLTMCASSWRAAVLVEDRKHEATCLRRIDELLDQLLSLQALAQRQAAS